MGESFAAALIALMVAGGNALEAFAEGRARREMTALLARAPRIAHRADDGQITDIAVEAIRPGDRLLVKPGETLPVDGVLEDAAASLDEAALTGEPLPVARAAGEAVRSGVVNAGGPLLLRASASAEASTYAAIVRLVRAAGAERPPMARLADRWALAFLPATLLASGLAWGLSGDPRRALAVLVVATPCPLILAAPVALVCGISRAAKRGVIIKGGGALERLARVRTALFDKTGTLTSGTPHVAAIEPMPGFAADEVLRLAASLDQVSQHVVARAIVAAGAGRRAGAAAAAGRGGDPRRRRCRHGGRARGAGRQRRPAGGTRLRAAAGRARPPGWPARRRRRPGSRWTGRWPACCCCPTGCGRRRRGRCGRCARPG